MMPSRVYRNKKIGDHIRSGEVACCITGSNYAVVNHHIIGHGYSGIGTKAPDFLQCAITNDLHRELHDHGWKAFERKYGRTQQSLVAETVIKLQSYGIIDLEAIELLHDVPGWLFHEMENIDG